MRRPLLFMGALALTLNLSAQDLVWEENFDSYNVGEGIAAQSDDFFTWNSSDTGTDAGVSDAYASSGSNSIEISFAGGSDIVRPMGPYTSGKYDIEFKMLVPNGEEAYFNVMHSWEYETTTNYEWACDIYFANGNMTWTVEGVDGGGLSFAHDTWMDVKIVADMDNDVGYIYLNGEWGTSFQWSANNADGSAGLNQLQAIDFYGWGPSGNTGLYYVDDLKLTETTGIEVGIAEGNTAEFVVFPNPANTQASVQLDANVPATIVLRSLDGRLVENIQSNGANGVVAISTANLTSGIYFVEVTVGAERMTQKLVVQH
ncbi:MAG: T9SS type A sorting domain-containing protein [Flavobacteriales bacterium]|nr:T9SS type A sorting domain-containing protein [Flavobacteriales bacterium]MDG2246666.1 T9SS type A sorting domain-containing protein [Flavobacteriales bacterium]